MSGRTRCEGCGRTLTPEDQECPHTFSLGTIGELQGMSDAEFAERRQQRRVELDAKRSALGLAPTADIMIARTRAASREIASLTLRIQALEQTLERLRDQRAALISRDAQTPTQEGTTP